MTDMILKVEPEVLRAKAGELSTERTTVLSIMDQAKSDVNSLVGVWKSEASDEYQNRFRQVYDDIDNMLGIVGQYISDINEVAGIYQSAEKAAKSTAEGLPTDGVFRV